VPTATICCVVSSHSILFTFVITLVEFGTARHVIPPSVEVDKEVVAAASSLVMGRVGAVMRVVEVMVKLAVMVTRPWPVLIAPASVKVVIPKEPPPPPEAHAGSRPPPPPE